MFELVLKKLDINETLKRKINNNTLVYSYI